MTRWLGLLVTVLLTACATVPAASPSSSTSSEARDAMPPGCRTFDLRSPAGTVVSLTGAWSGGGILAGHDETAWLHQVGDCVYGTVVGQEISMGPGQTIVNLSGRVGADLMIVLDVFMVSQGDQALYGVYSRMDMLIDWEDDGRISLREDRPPGEFAGRCVVVEYGCPDPLIWHRLDN